MIEDLKLDLEALIFALFENFFNSKETQINFLKLDINFPNFFYKNLNRKV